MFRFLFRLILKQKLYIGLLWLMLRGNTQARAQQIELKSTCYRFMPPGAFVIGFDLSAARQYPIPSFDNGMTSLQTGINYKNMTAGCETILHGKNTESMIGPYFRYFPIEREYRMLTIMTEVNYLLPFSKQQEDLLGASFGLIVSERSLAGFEIYQRFVTDISGPVKFNTYTGFRIHVYFAMKGK